LNEKLDDYIWFVRMAAAKALVDINK